MGIVIGIMMMEGLLTSCTSAICIVLIE